MLADRLSHFVTSQSAETGLGTAGMSACATLWRTLQRAASALMPALGWFRHSRAMIVVFLAIPLLARGAEPVAEYQVKGAFLLNFTKFVDWPPQAFKEPGDPIAICILGENPFGPLLDRAAQQTVVANRAVSVRQVADGQLASQCQVVFMGASERRHWRAWLEALRGGSVLTVGESEGFLASGGVVNFKLEGDRVRIEISTAAADRAGLHISAKLLSLAQSEKK
jgi:YfiR/HmsC-like